MVLCERGDITSGTTDSLDHSIHSVGCGEGGEGEGRGKRERERGEGRGRGRGGVVKGD